MKPTYLGLVLSLVLVVCSTNGGENRRKKKKSFDFNCDGECGKYEKSDMVGLNLHSFCDAMEKSDKCVKESIKGFKRISKRKKASKEGGDRIVGGNQSEEPMPWMTLISIRGNQCGGTLINNQFVLTAAHCFCGGAMMCERTVMDVKKNIPNKIKEDINVFESVTVFVGMTKSEFLEKNLGVEEIFTKYKDNQEYAYHASKIFLHPKLQTSEEFTATPDIALIKLERRVTFSNYVRPICLNRFKRDKPYCSDNSQDKPLPANADNKKAVDGKILGGCATVAGWGYRYDRFTMDDEKYSSCKTDSSELSPDKLQFCMSEWHSNGVDHYNCTQKDIDVEDLTKPCRDFIAELEFNKQLNKKRNESEQNPLYNSMDINEFSTRFQTPIEISISLQTKNRNGKKRTINFHCGKTSVSNSKNGWCATKMDHLGKIQRWGFCGDTCTDKRDSFMFANMNLLLDRECLTLFSQGRNKGEDGWNLYYNKKYEMCVGKKSQFPKDLMSFKRIRKSKSKYDKELKEAESLKLKPGLFEYKVRKKATRVSLGTKESYPYDWFLGGVDTCQGDSGGPLWRNIEKDGEVRATQIGVVSRGKGCAGFNDPAIFGRVKIIYKWIKKIVRKHKTDDNLCTV